MGVLGGLTACRVVLGQGMSLNLTSLVRCWRHGALGLCIKVCRWTEIVAKRGSFKMGGVEKKTKRNFETHSTLSCA